ncbi:MAG: 50S ribosomal protein L21e [Candidatus Aenigmarchaeota archaeon]|nr:50S ribosomal protein L21e [Candidatus Aenigmarchaeota archaeon]
MAKSSKGFRKETRRKLKKGVRDKFKPEDYIREFKGGQHVVLMLEPASHKGMPFPKFKGKIGKVKGRRGRAYLVEITDRGKRKTVIAKPEHLRSH